MSEIVKLRHSASTSMRRRRPGLGHGLEHCQPADRQLMRLGCVRIPDGVPEGTFRGVASLDVLAEPKRDEKSPLSWSPAGLPRCALAMGYGAAAYWRRWLSARVLQHGSELKCSHRVGQRRNVVWRMVRCRA